ncbi:MAG: hypothetical protein WAU20_13095, partial [Dokdonella sp.]
MRLSPDSPQRIQTGRIAVRFFLWPWMACMPATQEQLQAMPWMACMPATQDDCMDEGGTHPWMDAVERRREQPSRATQE